MAGAIPKIFHFVFGLREQTEPFHLMYYLCLRSCYEVNQPDEIHFHYQHEPHGAWWDRIKPMLRLRRIDPERLVAEYRYDDARIGQFRYAHLADFARLEILAREGGIYADIDTLFLRPLPDALRAHQFVLGREKAPPQAGDGGSLCNAWIASAPGAAFCRLWLEGMSEAFDGSWSAHSTLLPFRLSRAYPDLLHIEPESAFYALDWTRQGLRDLFEREVALPAHAYSLHLWNHLWSDSRRLDFSRFHAGRLTPDYVAFAGTTYARHARRFLPAGVSASRLGYTGQMARAAMHYPWLRLQRRLEAR